MCAAHACAKRASQGVACTATCREGHTLESQNGVTYMTGYHSFAGAYHQCLSNAQQLQYFRGSCAVATRRRHIPTQTRGADKQYRTPSHDSLTHVAMEPGQTQQPEL